MVNQLIVAQMEKIHLTWLLIPTQWQFVSQFKFHEMIHFTEEKKPVWISQDLKLPRILIVNQDLCNKSIKFLIGLMALIFMDLLGESFVTGFLSKFVRKKVGVGGQKSQIHRAPE